MFTAPSIVYHGPMNMDDLRKTANCIPQYGQDELGYVVSQPDVVMGGQPWGRRVAATYERVGRMFTPKDPWADRVRVTETDRVELCAQMLRDAPADELNTILLAQSLSRAFLARGNCDEFTASQGITLSQMETAPHFILPYDMVQADRTLVQTFNAVSKFMSATAVAASHTLATYRSHTGHIRPAVLRAGVPGARKEVPGLDVYLWGPGGGLVRDHAVLAAGYGDPLPLPSLPRLVDAIAPPCTPPRAPP